MVEKLIVIFAVFLGFLLSINSVEAAKKSYRPVVLIGSGAAAQHTCVVLSNGLGIKCLGLNQDGQLGQLHSRNMGDEGPFEMGDCLRTSALGERAKPVQVVLGESFTCALLDQGLVRCFGSCSTGACGIGKRQGTLGASPQENPGNQPYISLPFPAVQLSAGQNHVCAVLENKSAYCWGAGSSGQLGNGQMVDMLASPPASPIDFGLGRTVRQISAGYTHTCAILDSPKFINETDLICFGNCLFGKCGSGETASIITMGNSLHSIELGKDSQGKRRFAVQVSAGAAHTCVILNTNEAACFGLGRLLGIGPTENIGDNPFEMENLKPVSLNGRKVVSISAGQQHSCAVVIQPNGARKAVCWGVGEWGVLGYNSEKEVLSPDHRVVALPKNFVIEAVSAHALHTCSLMKNGRVACWGSRRSGRIGLLAIGAAAERCVGCKKGQMGKIKRLNVGCSTLSKNKSCPYLTESNPTCEICQAKWSKNLCKTYSTRCRWNRKLGQCENRK